MARDDSAWPQATNRHGARHDARMTSRFASHRHAAGLLLGLVLAVAGAARPASAADATEFSVVTLNLWHDKGDWA